jgi:hypothetical protein
MLLMSLVIALMAFPAVSSANHSWGNYHWARRSNPFTLRVGDNVTTAWDGHLNTTNTDWSKSTVMDLVKEAGTSSKRCSMVSGTIQVCNGTYGQNGWLGLASINVSGGHITQGTAKMNDTYFNSSYYNNPNEKLHVMCQEVGHTFGLGHTSEDGSSQNTCMDYFSNTGTNATSTVSTHPNQHDYDMLASIYSHTDSTTTIAASSALTLTFGDPDESHNWGRLVSQSANGRSSYYEAEDFMGNRTLRHVFWSEEAADRCHDCDHRYDH